MPGKKQLCYDCLALYCFDTLLYFEERPELSPQRSKDGLAVRRSCLKPGPAKHVFFVIAQVACRIRQPRCGSILPLLSGSCLSKKIPRSRLIHRRVHRVGQLRRSRPAVAARLHALQHLPTVHATFKSGQAPVSGCSSRSCCEFFAALSGSNPMAIVLPFQTSSCPLKLCVPTAMQV